MEDAIKLIEKKEALESENNSLRNVIEVLNAEKNALISTVHEILQANINFKAGAQLLESKIKRLSDEIVGLNGVIESLRAQLSENTDTDLP